MLKKNCLDKILDEDFGDAGYNDVVEIASKEATVKGGSATEPVAKQLRATATDVASTAAKTKTSVAPSSGTPSKDAQSAGLPEPYERPPVLGAAPLPREGADEEKIRFAEAMDQVARQKGYNSSQEYQKYLEQSGAFDDLKKEVENPKPELAPGIKKPPAWSPPGAYAGDRTKIGDAFVQDPNEPVKDVKELREKGVKISFVKQMEKFGNRPVEGNAITFRTSIGGDEEVAEIGSGTLPWALDVAAQRMKAGDIADVIGRGEYAFKDDEEANDVSLEVERSWHFELVAIEGKRKEKFSMSSEERLERANMLRLRGNDMFKRGRLQRAMDYYERGSSLMDVLEPEDISGTGKIDKDAAERNTATWQCQKPLLLNWALIHMKLGYWRLAERQCTEVLMDIDKLCVKALLRRGKCNLELGDPQQARMDLNRALELDSSLKAEVERELVKVEALQRAADKELKDISRKVVTGYVEKGDARSSAPPPKAGPRVPTPADNLMSTLTQQGSIAEAEDVDNDTYCRQREAIYNSFLRANPGSLAGPRTGS